MMIGKKSSWMSPSTQVVQGDNDDDDDSES